MIKGKNNTKDLIWTPREKEVIRKKLSGAKISQQDSNYLSKFVRPKLKEIKSIEAEKLLDKLNYNQKAISIEKKLKETILESLKGIDSISLYGSVIQTNYTDYNDVDVLVVVRKRFWKKLSEKYKKIVEIKKKSEKLGIDLDLEIYDKNTFLEVYLKSSSLIYQLRDRKTIYGNLKLSNNYEIPKIDLRMKLDYSVLDNDSSGEEIYKAIRNLVLVNLILDKVISNKVLNESLDAEVGKNLVERLKKGIDPSVDRKIGMLRLKELLKLTLRRIKEEKWEKIVLSSR